MTTTATRYRCTRPNCGRTFTDHARAVAHVERVHIAYAGRVEVRVNRTTGTEVSVVDGAGGLFDADEANRWWTVCEAHSILVSHPSLSLARSHAADPTAWCEDCR